MAISTTSKASDTDADLVHFHPLVSWRSVIAGLLVTFLSLVGLIALGMAFGGIGLDDGASLQSAGIFTGVWFLVSTILSLFAGSYFAARVSKFRSGRIGSAQGLVIAALFIGVILWQMMAALGWAGRMTNQAVSGAASIAGQGISQMVQNPAVNEMVEDAMGDLTIPPERVQAVVTGVGTRLLRGNTEGAKNYLARQAGISPDDADRRIAALRAQVDQGLIAARDQAASALRATGWTMFLTIVLATVSATLGGALGSRTNLRKPLVREQVSRSSEFRPATV